MRWRKGGETGDATGARAPAARGGSAWAGKWGERQEWRRRRRQANRSERTKRRHGQRQQSHWPGRSPGTRDYIARDTALCATPWWAGRLSPRLSWNALTSGGAIHCQKPAKSSTCAVCALSTLPIVSVTLFPACVSRSRSGACHVPNAPNAPNAPGGATFLRGARPT